MGYWSMGYPDEKKWHLFSYIYKFALRQCFTKIKFANQNDANWVKIYITSGPTYIKPSLSLTSLGCRMWSESLSSQVNLSLIGGPMFTDTHMGSIMHRFLQALRNDGTTGRERFLITWYFRAYPLIHVENLIRRQRPANNNDDNSLEHKSE